VIDGTYAYVYVISGEIDDAALDRYIAVRFRDDMHKRFV
jgi:hypothetical protein